MAKQTINLGTNPNDGTGSNLRAGGLIVNNNFNELYTALGDGSALNISTASASTDNVLKWNGSSFVPGTLALELSADSTPQLGGNLDINGNSIVSTSNGNIAITPNGSGKVILDGLSHPTADGSAGQFLKTDGSGNLSFSTVTSTFTLAADSGSNDTFATGETFTVAGGTGITTTVSNNQISVGLTSGNANSFFKIEDTSSTQETVNLGETLQIIGGPGITTQVGGNEININLDALTNANLSGSAAISNANLANSAVTLGNTSVSLGATAATLNNLSITGTGTIDSTGQSNKIRFQFANFASLPNSTNYEGMFATTLNDYKAYFAESDSWIQILSENSSIGLHSDVDVTTAAPALDQVLGWNSAQGEWEPHNVATLSTAGKSSAQVLKVSANGSSAYRFTSHYGTTDNPTLYTFQGQTIAFDLDDLGGSHPFVLQTSSGAYNSGNRITTGLTHVATNGTITTGVSAQGKTSGVLYFEVPIAQATIYYVCTSHSAMAGTLTVSSKTGASATVNGVDIDFQGADPQDVGYLGFRSPDDGVIKSIAVTVGTKTTEHYHHGTGSASGYFLDGHESPALVLAPGKYKFDQSDSTNTGHPLLFYSSWDKSRLISTGVTTSGTPGSAGAHTTLEIDGDTPSPLFYQCSAHAYMGHLVECLGAKRRKLSNTTDKTNSGNGSATTVTCLGGTTVDDVLVFVNGICLVPTDDYTISGTTLTFQVAPANGAEIVLRYLGQ